MYLVWRNNTIHSSRQRRLLFYTLVGEAYVYGLMEGEAIREWQSGRLIEEWYLLR